MAEVVSVRFRTAGKLYYFDPCDFEIKKGDHVIVETARGMEYGTVIGERREVAEENIVRPLKPIIRIATEEDDEKEADNLAVREDAYKICKEKIAKHGLPMKLVEAEYTFDRKKLMFYFTADNRIDFRELVKDLAAVFKTRIELRQIGVRDEIKLLGGVGMCGREFCCHSYLHEFAPVSIKMAKEQNLSLNPANVSGVCGRLMCCLKNEEETYEELNKTMPNVGDTVSTNDGYKGEVVSINVLRQKVRVVIEIKDDKEIREYNATELSFKKNGHKEKDVLSEEERKALELLEKQEREDIIETEREQEEEMKEILGSDAAPGEKKHHDRKKENRNSFEGREKKKEKKEWKDGGKKEHNKNENKSDKKKTGNQGKKNNAHYHNNRRESRPRPNGEE
ncbi:MAG: stage 0 sporulation family protein [Lachnospiraceae bacterium]|nr:stage 0 sporulation family protein [Lachnospiraceae bacterium]